MNKFLTYLVLIGGTLGFILFALESYNDSAAKRLYAQSAIIAAKSAARQDFMASALPYTIMGLGLIGLVLITGLIIFGVLVISKTQGQIQVNRPQVTERIIEKHMFYLLPTDERSAPGGLPVSRRQIYKQIEMNRGIFHGREK